MARTTKEMDLKTVAKRRYEELVQRRNDIDEELKGLEGYLKAVGGTGIKAKAGRKTTGQLPYERRVVSRAGRKTSATQSILSLIVRSEKGISIDEIMKQTGLLRNTVNGVLNRMKKERKIKAVKRGVYVKANSSGQTKTKRQGKKAEAASGSPAVSKKVAKAKGKAPAKRPTRVRKAAIVEKAPASEPPTDQKS